jgi:cytochrome b6-f complex iron-sulfur subunit
MARLQIEAPAAATAPRWTRRNLLKLGFWTGVGATLAAAGASVLNNLYPRGASGFGGPIAVPPERIPQPGEPPTQVLDGRFWLANLAPDEGRAAGDGVSAPGGLVALWWKCPHLGCTVPWKESYVAREDPLGRRGFFNCNCHGSTYTKAGVLVRGPAERAMDTMRIELVAGGGIVVQTGERTKGDTDNPRRATPWRPPA